jgi:N-acetylneuraminic acid mutarotase
VWGTGAAGHKNDAPSDLAGTWTAMPTAPLDRRYSFTHAWIRCATGICGALGTCISGPGSYRVDGAIYDAATNAWTALPAVPTTVTGRYQMPGLVIGNKFVVWGGSGSTPSYKNDGIVYDAVAKTWTLIASSPLEGRYNQLAVTDGTKAFYFGGYGSSTGGYYKSDGAVLDLTTLSWTATPTAGIEGRERLGGAWTPSGIIVWGGYGSGGANLYKNDGARYLP